MRGRISCCFALAFSLVMTACGEAPSSSDSALAQFSERMLVYGANGAGPNPELTPGDLCSEDDPDFDGYRYNIKLAHCRRAVTPEVKLEIAASYGISAADRHNYEIDHFIPLNIGGSNNPRNLWPLIGPLAREKSEYEAHIMNQVKARRLSQAAAIKAIRSWKPGLSY